MSREIQVRVFCDRCSQLHDLKTEGQSDIVLQVNGLARRVDLCEACEKEAVAPLVELMKVFGRKLDDTSAIARRGRRTAAEIEADTRELAGRNAPPVRERVEGECPVCPAGKTLKGDRNKIIQHLEKFHHMTTMQASNAYPPFGPTIRCPVGCGMLLADRPQAVAAHMRVHPKPINVK